MATIKDIAKHVGVSVSTVSYALNGGPRPVPPEVAARVKAAAKHLGYRPNRIARSLITGRSATLGIIPTDPGEYAATGPYFQVAFSGILAASERLRHDVIVFTGHGTTDPSQMSDVVLDGRADGVIFLAPRQCNPLLDILLEQDLPAVATSSQPRPGISTFTADNAVASLQALEHLYELGHRKIGHIAGFMDQLDGIARMEAYRSFMREKGLEIQKGWTAVGDFHPAKGSVAAREMMLLKNRPSAIFCANDEMAFGTLQAAWEVGLSVPTDISVVGIDDVPLSPHTTPALTTVRQPIQKIAEAATEALIGMLHGKPPVPNKVFPTELVVRSTTCKPLEETQ